MYLGLLLISDLVVQLCARKSAVRSVFDQPAQLSRALNVPTRPHEAMRRRVPFTFKECGHYSNREMPMSFAESSLIRAKRTPFSFFS